MKNITDRSNKFFAFLEDAKNSSSLMSEEEAMAAVEDGCRANRSLGWSAEEGLRLDVEGWYKASLHIDVDSEYIGVYIVEHMPCEYTAYSGWQDYQPSKNIFPDEGEDVFLQMVAGILRLSPEEKYVQVAMSDLDNTAIQEAVFEAATQLNEWVEADAQVAIEADREENPGYWEASLPNSHVEAREGFYKRAWLSPLEGHTDRLRVIQALRPEPIDIVDWQEFINWYCYRQYQLS